MNKKAKKTDFNAIMQKYSIFFILLLMIIISTILNNKFLSAGNIMNIAKQLAVPIGARMLTSIPTARPRSISDRKSVV